jgi:hypothetical protein
LQEAVATPEEARPVESAKPVASSDGAIKPDGPQEEGFFYHENRRLKFPDLQWRLLKCLFGKETVAIQEVIDEIYPGEDELLAAEKLRSLIYRTEKTFAEKHKVHCYDIEHPTTGHISLRRFG